MNLQPLDGIFENIVPLQLSSEVSFRAKCKSPIETFCGFEVVKRFGREMARAEV